MSSPKRPTKQLPSLPYDLILSCLARVSRLHYPTLSLVSKTFQSLIASPELYKTRSLLNRTESCLYVCLEFPSDPNPRWFTLCRKPNQTLTNDKKKSSGYVLIPISNPNSATPGKEYNGGLVAVGCNIYAIGGSIENADSSSVSILDCRTHMWHDGPSMWMKRNKPATNVVDGKIYVAGGCKDSSNGMEVFDLKTQTWELVLSRSLKNRILKSTVVEGERYSFGKKVGNPYKPKEGRWEDEGDRKYQYWNLDLLMALTCNCVIDNIVYFYSTYGGIQYCNSGTRCLKNLKGLQGLPKFHGYSYVKFADYGGKLAVFWDTCLPLGGFRGMKISCAVISLERRETKEIWGKVEWLDDAVLTVPRTYKLVAAIAAIL
ncbi:F-box/kelch-repeat protein [Cardamine amara subsp. amara]|uniref:F-box/kelch-repeat protein n=1 Tax=Cardamine amara subsp. amara TaxID=228776 RepID=A0ABD0ZU78_CARAN